MSCDLCSSDVNEEETYVCDVCLNTVCKECIYINIHRNICKNCHDDRKEE